MKNKTIFFGLIWLKACRTPGYKLLTGFEDDFACQNQPPRGKVLL